MKITIGALKRIIKEEVESEKYDSNDKGSKSDLELNEDDLEEGEECLDEVSPEGWEGTVKAMKKHPKIKNPWALSYYMKNKDEHSHYTKGGKKK